MKKNEKTIQYCITFGVNEGFSKNNTEANKLAVGEKIKEFIEKIEKKSGVYISGILYKNMAIYKNEWECPYGGEVTFSYIGNQNKAYCKSKKKYKKAVLNLAKKIKKEYGQEEVTVAFTKAELYHIEGKEK